MTKFNKTLLAAAVAGAIALPGIAVAASLGYEDPQQITYAKDLIVNDGTTIYTPTGLVLSGAANDAARLATVEANEEVRVKVTLTNGVRFDQTADANTLVEGFVIGTELGGDGIGTIADGGGLVGNAYYSNSGQELNFVFTAPDAGAYDADGFALSINSMQVTQLTGGLYDGSSIGAEITVQNASGQQILAARSEIAKSKWGLDVASDLTQVDRDSTIDVSAGDGFNRKTRFSTTGLVGGAKDTDVLWNAGAVVIDVAKALETDGVTESVVNNYSAVAELPEYNVVGTAQFNIQVKGSDLTAFADQNVFLSANKECDTQDLDGSLNAAGDTYIFNAPASHALFAGVTDAPPTASRLNVCFRASGDNEMNPQDLTATVAVDYRLSTQRVNPPATTVNLAPLTMNGEELIFQNVNPGQNGRAQSFLRITNNNADVCPITIDAKDDAGRLSGEVTFTLAPHASWHANSDTLENGADHFQGSFGDGEGRWYVRITAECDNIRASALNRNLDTGVVTNLTPEKGHGRTWMTPGTSL